MKKLIGVSVERCDRGIPLKWEDVKKALYLYANGATAGSGATRNDLEKNVSSAGGVLGIGLLLMSEANNISPNSFVDNLLAEASFHLKNSDAWSVRYDYDGIGYFHKTSVDIEVLDRVEGLYKMNIYAAYVGDEPEKHLAESLGVPRLLIRYTITAQVVPHDEKYFVFDFEKILRALDDTLKTQGLSGVKVANHFMSGDKYNNPKALQIYSDKDLSVFLGLGRVERQFVYNHEHSVHINTWIVKGSTLTGLLDNSFEQIGEKEIPTFQLTVVGAKKDSYGHNQAVWDAGVKEKIENKANAIAEALKNYQF